MTILRRNWRKLAGVLGGTCLLVSALYTCLSAWGQTAPGLKISVAPGNEVSLTVTNGIPTGIYHIYFNEFLGDPDFEWVLLTNGTTGQTNFSIDMEDFDQGFFKAINNSNFVAPSVTLIIQSPANGAVVQ
jgi:hypothetical protein